MPVDDRQRDRHRGQRHQPQQRPVNATPECRGRRTRRRCAIPGPAARRCRRTPPPSAVRPPEGCSGPDSGSGLGFGSGTRAMSAGPAQPGSAGGASTAASTSLTRRRASRAARPPQSRSSGAGSAGEGSPRRAPPGARAGRACRPAPGPGERGGGERRGPRSNSASKTTRTPATRTRSCGRGMRRRRRRPPAARTRRAARCARRRRPRATAAPDAVTGARGVADEEVGSLRTRGPPEAAVAPPPRTTAEASGVDVRLPDRGSRAGQVGVVADALAHRARAGGC